MYRCVSDFVWVLRQTTAEEALADCHRRFKNLPDRHFASVEALVRGHFKTNRLAVR